MAQADSASVSGALDHLVNQFSDPLSFLRELIQNAVDAGSRDVEVWIEGRAGEDEGDGRTMIIHVDDFGEGMDREIIDTRLTRLFSSAKDGDLTKIGRFGIGFASVFAIQPDAVCVDTSRGGENWRILFREDRTFTRIERDHPTEGTQIQVIKAVTQEELEDFEKRAREVIRFWCKHVDAEIRFGGEAINQPFDLDLPLKVTSSAEGTEIVAGYTTDGSGVCGYYNKGLTLIEGVQTAYPRVAFKVSSRYLEHTLTRDSVLHDENYDKAMLLVHELVTETLRERLFERLDELLNGEPATHQAEAAYLQTLVAWHLTADDPLPSSAPQRAVLLDLDGEPQTLAACREAAEDRKLYFAECASPLSAALSEQGYVVASAQAGDGLLEALCGGSPPDAGRRFCLPLMITNPERLAKWAPLRAAAQTLFKAAGFKARSLELAHLAYEGSSIGGWSAMSQKKLGELTPRAEARTLGTTLLSRKRVVVVNADHPTIGQLMAMAAAEPELAAYTLAKLFFLGGKLDAEMDGTLSRLSVEQRCRRLSS